jgi:hypothetical protein
VPTRLNRGRRRPAPRARQRGKGPRTQPPSPPHGLAEVVHSRPPTKRRTRAEPGARTRFESTLQDIPGPSRHGTEGGTLDGVGVSAASMLTQTVMHCNSTRNRHTKRGVSDAFPAVQPRGGLCTVGLPVGSKTEMPTNVEIKVQQIIIPRIVWHVLRKPPHPKEQMH